MRKEYITLEVNILHFAQADVITASDDIVTFDPTWLDGVLKE